MVYLICLSYKLLTKVMAKKKIKTSYKKPKIKEKNLPLNVFFNQNKPPGFLMDLEGGEFLAVKSGSGVLASCFPGRMKVLTKNNLYKRLDSIKEGEEIISYNFFKRELIVNKIFKVKKYDKIKGEILTINGSIEITPNHPVVINNKLWKFAGDIKKGDEYFSSKKSFKKVNIINHSKREEILFNLILENNWQNFFVEDCLVFTGHNAPRLKTESN